MHHKTSEKILKFFNYSLDIINIMCYYVFTINRKEITIMDEILVANMDDINNKAFIIDRPNTPEEQAFAYLEAYELETAKGE